MKIDLPGRRVEWFPSLDSTMTVAARLAREGCASGTVVGADEQTAGIGRAGHSWHSEPEAGLYVSIVLRLALGPESLPLVMLALGLATRDAIADVTGLAPDLRWPNDVLLGEKKCAGILAQMEGDAVIAGIGINVGHASFPPEIAPLATSLRMAGASVSREEAAWPVGRCRRRLLRRADVSADRRRFVKRSGSLPLTRTAAESASIRTA